MAALFCFPLPPYPLWKVERHTDPPSASRILPSAFRLPPPESSLLNPESPLPLSAFSFPLSAFSFRLSPLRSSVVYKIVIRVIVLKDNLDIHNP